MTEAVIRDTLAAALLGAGLTVSTEFRVNPFSQRRADVVVWNNDKETLYAIIEVKQSEFIRGVGQLVVYAAQCGGSPRKILAVPEPVHPDLKHTLAGTGIELWPLPMIADVLDTTTAELLKDAA